MSTLYDNFFLNIIRHIFLNTCLLISSHSTNNKILLISLWYIIVNNNKKFMFRNLAT